MQFNRIIKLDEKTASKIAAGEVVERPAMVVKELVENAIDAGGSEIIVDIKKGGKAYIKVTDNGLGIHYDDLPLVFERHATSKIRMIEDLYMTASLGFRGEALASICAVSNVELITMRSGETLGVKVAAAGGTIQKVSEVGTIQGTTIIVRDLFYNTPARLKFLKSDQAEGRSITELMGYLALSHPEISFKYSADDKLVFHTQGKGSLSNAIFSVFDPGLLKGLYEIKDASEHLKLSGYISKFDFTKGTKAYQLVFVNGRYVKSDLIKEVIGLAYKPYMMNNRYPVCVLFLEIPPSEIDVNIHPAKTEIKFHDDGQIKQFIFSALKKAFNLYDQVPKATFTEREVFRGDLRPDDYDIDRISEYKTEYEPKVPTDAGKPSFVHKPLYENKPSYEQKSNDQPKPTVQDIDFSSLTAFAETLSETDIEPTIHLETLNGTIYDDLIYVGVFNRTYLIYEKQSTLYMIDQHAAHEKILYETYMQAFERQEIQSQVLLLPEVVNLTPLEMSKVDELNSVLNDLGYGIDIFGEGSIVIREIPSMFTLNMAIEMVRAIFDDADNDIKSEQHNLVAEKACKAAIKAHDVISDIEQSALIDSLKRLDSPYTCPHGRPIVIKFTLGEIERKFKRVL